MLNIFSAVMVGVGGTIGTGLFLSSGDVISTAGPGGAVNITTQLVASAIIMRDIIPNSPTWLWILVFAVILFGVNFLDAQKFGNVSFVASSLKILMIVGFVIVGAALVFGIGPNEAIGMSNYTEHGGLFPAGLAGMGAVTLTSFYAYAGTEVVASTAGELKDEGKISRMINMTMIILVGATVISIAVVAAILPWDSADLSGSPFVYAFREVGMDGAALLVNIVVLSSALTSGNYFTYANARYIWSMAKFNQAPKVFAKTSKNGVLYVGLIVSMVFALFGVLAEFFAPDTAYKVLVWYIGGANIFMYSVICICQYNFRKRYVADRSVLSMPGGIPFFRVSSITTIYSVNTHVIILNTYGILFFKVPFSLKGVELDERGMPTGVFRDRCCIRLDSKITFRQNVEKHWKSS